MKAIFFFLICFPVFATAQEIGNFKVDANNYFYYEKVFDAKGMSAEKIQPIIVSKVSSIPGIGNVVAANNIVVANYINARIILNRTKGKLKLADALDHFHGKISVEIKDNRYRVRISNMGSIIGGQYFSFEEMYMIKKKPNKAAYAVFPKIDNHFTGYYSLTSGDDW